MTRNSPCADVIELYQLRWQIELFFKEAQIHTWIASLPLQEVREGGNLGHALPGDCSSIWSGFERRKLKQKALKKKEREWWQAQRTYGLALAVRQEAEQRELKLLAEKMETPTGRKVLAQQLRQSHPKEYRRGDLNRGGVKNAELQGLGVGVLLVLLGVMSSLGSDRFVLLGVRPI